MKMISVLNRLLHLKRKFSILVFFCALFGAINLHAQDEIYSYEYLTLKQFLETKIENDTNFVRQIYENCRYPKRAQKLEVETTIEVIIISHVNKEYEVIVLNHMNLFDTLEEEVLKGLNNLKIDQANPFITRIKLSFTLESHQGNNKKNHSGLIKNDVFRFVNYRFPIIEIN